MKESQLSESDLEILSDGKVCISLKELFNYSGITGKLAYANIRYEKIGDIEYYDLMSAKTGNKIVCCDGEECTVVKRYNGIVELVNNENGSDTIFYLTDKEFEVATFASVK